MALFGDDMIDVTTPDGRRLTVPSQFAAQYPDLRPVAPPQPTWTPADTQSLAALTPLSDPASSPVTSPEQLPPPPVPTPGPTISPAQAMPDDNASLTNSRLASMGIAGGANAENSALEQSKAASRQLGEAQANEATAVGASMAAADAHAQQLLEQRKQIADAAAAAQQARMTDYMTAAKRVADTKIDRGVDRPILAAISVVLSALGSAMKKENGNPALDALYKAIDRKVDGQMQDLAQRRAGLGDMRDAMGMSRQSEMDHLTEMDTYRVGYLEQAKRQVETIKAQSQSAIVKANAQNALADIGQKQAGITAGAQQRWQAQQNTERAAAAAAAQHAATIGVTLRGQNLEQRRYDLDRVERMRKDLLDEAVKAAAQGDKAKADRLKEIGERGINDPRTGDQMLTVDGQKKLSQADSLEVQARSAPPETAPKMIQQAQALRESARQFDAAVATKASDPRALQEKLNAAQSVTDQAYDVEQILSAGPSGFDRDKWAEATTKLGNIAATYVKQMGERVSPKAIENAIKNIENFDPSNFLDREISTGKALSSLKALRAIAKSNADGELKGAGIKTGWTPKTRDEEATKLNLDEPTALETGAKETPGAATKYVSGPIARDVDVLLHPLANDGQSFNYDPTKPVDAAADAAAGRTEAYQTPGGAVVQRSGLAGLSPAATASVQDMARRAAGATDKQRDAIVQALANPIAANLQEDGRPGVAWGVITVLKSEDPKLYSDVIDQLPAEQAKEIRARDAATLDQEFVGKLTPRQAAEYRKANPDSGLNKRTIADLSDEERKQLEEQRAARAKP